MQDKKLILILGGSTFVDQRYEVHYINRGKKYWNNEVLQYKNAIYTYGNRDELKDYTKVLMYLSNKLGVSVESDRKWEAVIDFCCFQAKQVRSINEALSKLVNVYILISTDSIYDVCDLTGHSHLITEDLDARPESRESYNRLKRDEQYGHDKLKCEEFLKYYIQRDEFPFIILRLPDILGPYEETGRFWAYVKWVEQMNQRPLEEDTFSNTKPLSFVYSLDIVRLIKDMLDSQSYKRGLYQSFNVCQDDVITLKQFIIELGSALGQEKLNFIQSNQRARKFFPSVDCGPICNKKVKDTFGAQFRPIKEVITQTTLFFKNIQPNYYVSEEEQAIKKLKKKLED